MIVTTDKTNSFRSTKKKYITVVEEHIIQSEKQIYRDKVIQIFGDAKLLVHKNVFRMYKNEVEHINE